MARAPFDTRTELKDLCDWLVCCSHLWPPGPETDSETAPFSLHAEKQTLRVDPERVENTVYAFLGQRDTGLLKDINDYVLENGESHWQALRKQGYSGATIDPEDVPRHWPAEYLRWAIYTIDMRNADLSWANFSGLHLRSADLRRADLGYSCMDGSDMRGAQLSEADIEGATFMQTNLEEANLNKVRFGTDKNRFAGAILDGASLTDITLDIAPYETDAAGKYMLRKGLLPPLVERQVRENLNDRIKRQHSRLAVKHLHRFLPHITMSPEFCLACVKLTDREDRLAVLQKLIRHLLDQYYAEKLQDIASIYAKIAIIVENRFKKCIAKENLDGLRKVLEAICRKNLVHLENAAQYDPWRDFWKTTTGACQKLDPAETKICLKELTQILLDNAQTSVEGIDCIRQSLRYLDNADPVPAFLALTSNLSPQQLHDLIQEKLDIAFFRRGLQQNAEMPAPSPNAPVGKKSASPSIRQHNPRQLIDLLHEQLPPGIRMEIHTLLQDETEEMDDTGKPKKIIALHEGDCDYLGSYTIDGVDGTAAMIDGAAAALHADQMESNDAPSTPTPAWQSAIFAYMLLPAPHFLGRYTAGFSFSTTVAANDDSGPA